MVKVALAQVDLKVGDFCHNYFKIVENVKDAKEKNCQIVIFPELSDLGYDLIKIKELAFSWQDRPLKLLKEIARENDIYIIIGLSERQDDKIYNSLAVISNQGKLLAKYRKTHLFACSLYDEADVFSLGKDLVISSFLGMNWGFSICYDLRFPEVYQFLKKQKVNLFVNIAAWPLLRITHWQVLAQARAIENQVYLLGVNRVGLDAGVCLGGKSIVVNPLGELVSLANLDEEELIVVQI